MNKVIEHHNKAWIDSTWDKVEKKLLKVAVKSRDKIPYTTIDGVHDDKAEGKKRIEVIRNCTNKKLYT